MTAAAGREAAGAPPGLLGREGVVRLAEVREIDTVLVCMVDMQGQLAGKRLTARHFLETRDAEVHACDYLLGVDLEMQPVAGLAANGWERGFGDLAIWPDFRSSPLPRLQLGRSLVLGETV